MYMMCRLTTENRQIPPPGTSRLQRQRKILTNDVLNHNAGKNDALVANPVSQKLKHSYSGLSISLALSIYLTLLAFCLSSLQVLTSEGVLVLLNHILSYCSQGNVYMPDPHLPAYINKNACQSLCSFVALGVGNKPMGSACFIQSLEVVALLVGCFVHE